jgi:hypothetical protein
VDDPQDLLRTIHIALLMTVEEKKLMGLRAAKRIEDLSPEKIGPKLIDIYERAIASRQHKNDVRSQSTNKALKTILVR